MLTCGTVVLHDNESIQLAVVLVFVLLIMLHLRQVGSVIHHKFAIDTNVASYAALSGKLWIPYINLLPGANNLDEISQSLPRKRVTACYKWMMDRQNKVVSTPTVVSE